MQVIRTKYSGFCPGVTQAEKKIFKARKQHAGAHIYILGYLIHNQTYIDYLSKHSVVTVSGAADLPDSGVVVIRTHGIRRQVEAQLREKYQVLDLTCPKVKKIQLIIQEHARKGCFVLITGKRDHPEVQGLLSYAANSDVIERPDDIVRFTQTLAASQISKVFVVSQTTGEPELFHETVRRVGEKTEALGIGLESYDSICSITALREKEALALRQEVDVTFVIGDRISSNATKLYKILAAQAGASVFFVNSREELESLGLNFSPWKTAQVVSSSSTPAFLEQEIVGYLEGVKR
jgi:4-hydroxy-3-methylbut-2-enyl diphosphate reductase